MSEVMTKAVVRGAEWQKMVAGAPYDAGDPELKAARERCRKLYHTFNTSWQEKPVRDALLHELLGGKWPSVRHQPAVLLRLWCQHLRGENFYANVGCILDVCEVHIGDNVLAPGCRSTPPLIRWRWRRASRGGVRQAGAHRPQRLDWRQRSHLPRRHHRGQQRHRRGLGGDQGCAGRCGGVSNPCKVLRPMTAEELAAV